MSLRLLQPTLASRVAACEGRERGSKTAMAPQTIVEAELVAALGAHQEHEISPLPVGPAAKAGNLRDEQRELILRLTISRLRLFPCTFLT